MRLLMHMGVAIPLAIGAWTWTDTVGYTFGPWFAAMIVLIALAKAWIEPDHVRAWGIGSKGESVTEGELAKLPDDHAVLHDRRLPGSPANIDHLVIGPGGVFVVESKRMAGKLTVRGNEVFVRGRNTHMVDQVLHQVETVEAVLADACLGHVSVRPILFVQKADPPWFLSPPLGVPIVVSGRRLRRTITEAKPLFTEPEAKQVHDVLERALRPMVREVPAPLPVRPLEAPTTPEPVLAACPRCGNEMVLRRNRQGQAFLGCSQFPNCRGTRPWRDAP